MIPEAYTIKKVHLQKQISAIRGDIVLQIVHGLSEIEDEV